MVSTNLVGGSTACRIGFVGTAVITSSVSGIAEPWAGVARTSAFTNLVDGATACALDKLSLGSSNPVDGVAAIKYSVSLHQTRGGRLGASARKAKGATARKKGTVS